VNPNQPVILMTGSIEESIEQQAHDERADAILRKPLDRDELVSVIRSLVELSCRRGHQ
jgi:CheY-like chemotaxis protein